MTKTFKIHSKESKESKEVKTFKLGFIRAFGGRVPLPQPYIPYQILPSLLLTILTGILVCLWKSTENRVLHFSPPSTTFVVQDTHYHGQQTDRSSKKGRHTGASPEASHVPSTWVSCSDLPSSFTSNLSVMQDTKRAGQNLSKPDKSGKDLAQFTRQFFSIYGSPAEIDQRLFAVLVASFNSPDSAGLHGLELANRLSLYKGLVNLLRKLSQQCN